MEYLALCSLSTSEVEFVVVSSGTGDAMTDAVRARTNVALTKRLVSFHIEELYSLFRIRGTELIYMCRQATLSLLNLYSCLSLLGVWVAE